MPLLKEPTLLVRYSRQTEMADICILQPHSVDFELLTNDLLKYGGLGDHDVSVRFSSHAGSIFPRSFEVFRVEPSIRWTGGNDTPVLDFIKALSRKCVVVIA